MTKAIEFIVVLTLLIFAFFAGVNYSDSIKNHASWLFEPKEEEIALPDLSNENLQEIESPMDESAINNGAVAPSSLNIQDPAQVEPISSPELQ
jgi:hypothetical protein